MNVTTSTKRRQKNDADSGSGHHKDDDDEIGGRTVQKQLLVAIIELVLSVLFFYNGCEGLDEIPGRVGVVAIFSIFSG